MAAHEKNICDRVAEPSNSDHATEVFGIFDSMSNTLCILNDSFQSYKKNSLLVNLSVEWNGNLRPK